MNFINPKTDFAFKKIFGSDQSKPILISFLNALLYDEQPVIEDLEILNPYLAPKIVGMKDTYVDVRARLQGGLTVIIEMQVLNVEGFEKRVLYNAAKAYSSQLKKSKKKKERNYRALNPVVALTITNFVMFPEHDEVQSAYVLKEKERLTDYREGDLELVFVELPKFNKTLDELAGVKDKWLYFLREAPDLEVAPPSMTDVPEIEEAFELANEANLSEEELDEQERKLIFIIDQQGAISLAVKNAEKMALERGMEKGVKKGEKKGLKKGLKQGREQMAREMAQKLSAEMSAQAVAKITGLPLKIVSELRTKH